MVPITVYSADGNELCSGLQPLSVSDTGLAIVMSLASRYREVYIASAMHDAQRVSSRMGKRRVRRLMRQVEV